LKNKSVFSDEEIKELFEMLRKAASGELTRMQALECANMVAEALRSRGIEPESYWQ